MDELEKEINGLFGINKKIYIIRLNIQDEVGMQLAPIYGFEFTPTFIYFDSQGNELWRMVGDFDPQRVRDSLE